MQGQILGILSWTMLAARPSARVASSSAASRGDYGLQLVWCLVIACAVAYVLLEAAGRMVIGGGQSLGQAMINKFTRRCGDSHHLLHCCHRSTCGQLVLQRKQFAGGMSAAYVLHENSLFFRWCHLVWAGADGPLIL